MHGGGRTGGGSIFLKSALKRDDMDAWLQRRSVLLAGSGRDESPQARRRVPGVIAVLAGMVRAVHTRSPVTVAMADLIAGEAG